MSESKNPAWDVPYDKIISWKITDTCNFNCPQCVGFAKPLKGTYAPEKIDINGLEQFLLSLDKPVLFLLTGGEPFLIENINQVIKAITKEHYISFISNLVSPGVQEFISTVNPRRVFFSIASAHIMELEKQGLMDIFIERCRLLKEKGFHFRISEVGYPFRMNKVEKYRQIFKDEGLTLEFTPFRGNWKNKDYPDSYTKEELETLNVNDDQIVESQVSFRKGKPCNAGYNIAVMDTKGKITPCYSTLKSIGSLKKGVSFNKTLLKCPVTYCDCPFPVSHQIEYERALEETGLSGASEGKTGLFSFIKSLLNIHL